MVDPEQKHGPRLWPSVRSDAMHRSMRQPRAGAEAMVPLLQRLAGEVRAMLGAGCAVLRIATDDKWTHLISATARSPELAAWQAEHSGEEDPADCLAFPLSKPVRRTQERGADAAYDAPEIRGADPCGLLAVPLVTRQGRNFGVIELSAKAGGEFTAADEATLVQLARIVAVAVEYALALGDQPEMFMADAPREVSDESQKMEVLGQLAGGVAHDFNNLLTVILGYCEVLLRRFDAKDATRDLLMEIHKAGSLAETLTRQLLTFSQKQVVDMKVLDLNAIVSDTESMLRRLIGEDVVLATNLNPDVGSVIIDPGQMQQVILNLAVNARDAMPRGGRLTIETDTVALDPAYSAVQPQARQGEYAMLAISDTGVGMNSSTKARIFEPLFTTKGPGKGTGLGLTTVKNILKQCGGHIEVYSEPGRGSSFKVYLPQARSSRARRKKPTPVAEPMPRGYETVLLVEDDDCVRSLARQVLEICGYTVLDACDGADALRRFESATQHIDLLVSDIVMPFVDGRELADRLLESKPNLKVLFVSGYPNDAVVRHGVLDPDDSFLQKPFTTCSLAQKVRQALDQKV